MKAGLARTRAQLGGKLKTIFSRGKVDEELLEELESLLLTSDVGLEATFHLLEELKARAKRDRIDTPEGIQKALSDALHDRLVARLDSIEAASREEAGNWQRVEREILQLKAELPLNYVRREDYVQSTATIMAKLDAISLRFENVLLQRGKNHE